MSKPYCVYILYDPRDNTQIYVGHGRNIGRDQRPKDSCTPSSHNGRPELKALVKEIKREGYRIRVERVMEFDTKEEARRVEVEFIKYIGRRNAGTGPLYNLVDEGSTFTEERLKNMAEANRKRMANLTDEERKDISRKAGFTNRMRRLDHVMGLAYDQIYAEIEGEQKKSSKIRIKRASD